MASQGRLHRFGFVLTEDFSLLAFTGLIDALRELEDHGRLTGRRFCRWDVLGPAEAPARASCGVAVPPTADYPTAPDYDYVFVIGGRAEARTPPAAGRFLLRAAAAGAVLVGVDTGTFVLARLGLLDGFRICVHWFHYRDFTAEFPQLEASYESIFLVDRRRITCAGGTCSIDLGAYLIDRIWGKPEATRAITLMGLEQVRQPQHHQAPYFEEVPPVVDGRVRRALRLIEARYDDPPSLQDLAAESGTSERQLARAFHSQLGLSPTQFARLARLRHGHWLLCNSGRPIAQIAFDCGFADSSHFTRFFRRQFGETPHRLRQRRREEAALGLRCGGPVAAPREAHP